VPHLLGLCLDTGNAIKDADRPIKDAERAEDFKSKVSMARSVNEVNGVRYLRFRNGLDWT
jgi:hypothetical protein